MSDKAEKLYENAKKAFQKELKKLEQYLDETGETFYVHSENLEPFDSPSGGGYTYYPKKADGTAAVDFSHPSYDWFASTWDCSRDQPMVGWISSYEFD